MCVCVCSFWEWDSIGADGVGMIFGKVGNRLDSAQIELDTFSSFIIYHLGGYGDAVESLNH